MKDIKEVLQTEDGIEEAAKDSANGEYKRIAGCRDGDGGVEGDDSWLNCRVVS